MKTTGRWGTVRWLLVIVVMAVLPAAAFGGPNNQFSAWASTIPTINGTISAGEWSDADTFTATIAGANGELHPFTLYVKNDASYLYLAVRVDDEYSEVDEWGYDFLNFRFDNNNDGVPGGGDDGINIRFDNTVFVDSFMPGDAIGSNYDDTYYGGTNDLTGAITHTNPVPNGWGTYTVEYRHPLNSADNAHDFSLTVGSRVGFIFMLADGEPSDPEATGGYFQWPTGGYRPGVIIVAGATNAAPTANAGTDQLVLDSDRNGSHSVTLSGSATDSDGYINTYVWKEGASQIATGASATLNLAVGTHTITLTVTDNRGGTATDTVTVTVNAPPTANAGPDQVVTDTDRNGSQAATLDGSASLDSDGTLGSYVWKEGASQIATGANPAVTLALGSHTITLTVTDNNGATASDTVTVVINAPPTANAGPDQVVTDTDRNGSHIAGLNGSASYDSDGSIASYVWSEGGSQIATEATRTVTLTVGSHTITLTVTDTKGATATDTVTVIINAPPTANAGADQVVTDADRNGSHDATLNGSLSSDSDGTLASYVWSEGGTQIATGASATVTFAVGSHSLALTVTDNYGAVATDTLVVIINAPPTANAGADQVVTDADRNGSHAATLSGSSSSDSDGTLASYVWSESGPQIATGASPTVTLTVGTHTITLTVTDNLGATATDTLVVIINAPPTANAGSNQVVTDADRNGTHSATLNGTGSTDSDGSIASYAWSEGATQIATGASPTVTLSLGVHTITLTVTDNRGAGSTATVTISLYSPPLVATTLCDGKTSPANNVSTYTPVFSWSSTDLDPGDSQTAYRLRIGTLAGQNNVFDSGAVASSSGSFTSSVLLSANTTYHWSVQTWDTHSLASGYSADALFIILDIGLRVYDGTQTIKIATDYVGPSYKLRISKGGTTYGIILVDPADPSASKIRVRTSTGVMALKKM